MVKYLAILFYLLAQNDGVLSGNIGNMPLVGANIS